MRNDYVTWKVLTFHKIGKNQHANELWYIQALFSRFGFFQRTSSKYISSGLIHAKEMSFSIKRKVVKNNLAHGTKATISTWKVIKIQFNFGLWFIDGMPNQAHRQKNFAGRIRLLLQSNGAIQNYSMLRPGYRSFRFLYTECTVGTYYNSICAEKNGQDWILCLKKMHHHGNV